MQFVDFFQSELSDIKCKVASNGLILDFLGLRIGIGKTYGLWQSVQLCTTFGEIQLSAIY